jgi:isochorismate synthase/2-succinyl-5-enolpyruvyl-6-hydroxy-3-cyclohexene-1-carboxylate synthase/2-succinyl-6-hydroxy-2,4-cyclohexadiene-1-carboxylate synthase/O-succinylbenzoate synthase
VQYVEEPVSDLVDLAAFHCTTGVPVALDESVDEAMRGGADGARDGDGDDDDDSTGSLNALIELF